MPWQINVKTMDPYLNYRIRVAPAVPETINDEKSDENSNTSGKVIFFLKVIKSNFFYLNLFDRDTIG